MLDRIKHLEKLSRALEPDTDQRRLLREKVIRYGDSLLENFKHNPAFNETEDKGIGLYDSPIGDDPIDIDAALEILKTNVDRPGVLLGSAAHLAYIPSGGLYMAALAEYLVAIGGRYAGLFFASPGAVRMERMLLRWIAEFIGYPETAKGDLTSGGSMSSLIAIVTAREAYNLKTKDFPDSVVYLTNQTHHTIIKALRIAGLDECIKQDIPLDQNYRMRPEALEQAILSDKSKGFKPWLIVASAGTTDTGAVDPMETIADIAKRHQLWLHVDGAYGAAFALCKTGKEILKGSELSDSIIINPHKGFFMPQGSGAVLIRDGQKLYDAHHSNASYLQDQESLASPDEISPADLSPELSRPFRGLRLWLSLKLTGVAPFRAALEEKLLLARYFYEKMQQVDGFELGPYPDLSIVTFRYIPKQGNVNEFNHRLINALHRDGRIFISSTMIDGKFTLRMAILGFNFLLKL
jgi:glutamate/tyrosine decarboxylase-like PLP-dependent enzyme